MSGFYARLRRSSNHDDALAECVERVVNQLESELTSGDRPGILLGKIQSGKTRGFVGTIARAFDREFDMALVLTKGTKTLSAQTVARLRSELSEFIEEDELVVLDIMKLPGKLTRSELSRKIVIVAKKQHKNMELLINFIEQHSAMKNRRVLLIDDEADLASVRFVKKVGKPKIEQGTIAGQIDTLRGMMSQLAFLQVTATPYSLYLQPEAYEPEDDGFVFKPKRPAFTELLPIHSGYVGGDDYFGGFDDDDPRHYLFVEVAVEEHDALRKADRRRINSNSVLNSPNTVGLRRAIITFVLAVCIRRWQQQQAGERKLKYAMIIHNDPQRAAHNWQDQVIEWIFEAILHSAEKKPLLLRPLFDEAYDDLESSVTANKGRVPERDEIFDVFIDALQSDDVVRERVNSDNDVLSLLDEKAELKLRTPFNIYIGGNILDRGITIPNLVAFYYGRNPKTMQADTVLQHSRMYGNRGRADLAVTRFYTSYDVYDRLYTINGFENALREAFESGAHDRGVIFIQSDADKKVRPCAPNKLLLSDVISVKPGGFLLPAGFETISGKDMKAAQVALDKLIDVKWRDKSKFFSTSREHVNKILDSVAATFIFEDVEYEWDAMKSLLDYYTKASGSDDVLILAETGRQLHRIKSGDKSGKSILGTVLRDTVASAAKSSPALVLLQQEGTKEQGWSGHKFWWPVLVAPGNVEPCVFASKVMK